VSVDRELLLAAFGGGLAIGLAATLLFALQGRLLGVSGLINGLLDRLRGDRDWRAALLVGVVLGALAWTALAAGAPAPRSGFPGWALALAGLLVGYGTRVGSGCTSGHGVCGIARLSPRSILATTTFISTGALTLYLLRHALGVLP
jgi:uncharacterized membrane protein YedE/YeeE